MRILFMPYLQLDAPAGYTLEGKRGLARRLGKVEGNLGGAP
jgi:hypothetical protein